MLTREQIEGIKAATREVPMRAARDLLLYEREELIGRLRDLSSRWRTAPHELPGSSRAVLCANDVDCLLAAFLRG